MRISTIALALTVWLAWPAKPADACTPTFAGGAITIGQDIPIADAVPAALEPCMADIAGAITARPWVRSVTIVAHAKDEDRVESKGLKAARAVADLLEQAGVDASMLSVVSAPLPADGYVGLRIRYVAVTGAPVAMVVSAGGTVELGKESMQPATEGGTARAGDTIRTGSGSYARLYLVDGSVIHLASDSAVRVDAGGGVDVDAGDLSTAVVPAGAKSPLTFRVAGRTITADNAHLRIHKGETSRVEVMTGKVDVDGTAVPAGQGAVVSSGGVAPVALLAAPVGLRPVMGSLSGALTWKPVDGASGYQVELARDADFSDGYSVTAVAATELTVPSAADGGRWFWRVSAVGGHELAGPHSKIYAFEK